MSTAKSLLKYAVGWDLTSEDSVAQPTQTTGETVMTEKGQPLPYPLDVVHVYKNKQAWEWHDLYQAAQKR